MRSNTPAICVPSQLMLNQQAHQKQLEKKMSTLEKQLLEVSFSSQNSGGSIEEFEKLHEINASLEASLAEHTIIITELQTRVRLVSSRFSKIECLLWI